MMSLVQSLNNQDISLLNARKKDIVIGVLGIQGAVTEHVRSIQKCGAKAVIIRDAAFLDFVDGLILPGGESTTIGRLSVLYHYREKICLLASKSKPILGTCAGLILIAKHVHNQEPILSLMSVSVRRNAFGRQKESYETDLDIPLLGSKKYTGVFIRAPLITSVGTGVQILSSYKGEIVAAQENNIIGTSFHPELTDDLRIHRHFLAIALSEKLKSGVSIFNR